MPFNKSFKKYMNKDNKSQPAERSYGRPQRKKPEYDDYERESPRRDNFKKDYTKKTPYRKFPERSSFGHRDNEESGSHSSREEKVVNPAKLLSGLETSKTQIRKQLQQVAEMLGQDDEVVEIEVALSFNSEGKFIGFGEGGAASIKVKVQP